MVLSCSVGHWFGFIGKELSATSLTLGNLARVKLSLAISKNVVVVVVYFIFYLMRKYIFIDKSKHENTEKNLSSVNRRIVGKLSEKFRL